jgi:hypothetical protein
MSRLDLQAKYGKKNVRRLLNAAIRAELPGGAEAIDALDELRRWQDRRDDESVQAALALLRRIIDAMALEIRRRYDLLDEPTNDEPTDGEPPID